MVTNGKAILTKRLPDKMSKLVHLKKMLHKTVLTKRVLTLERANLRKLIELLTSPSTFLVKFAALWSSFRHGRESNVISFCPKVKERRLNWLVAVGIYCILHVANNEFDSRCHWWTSCPNRSVRQKIELELYDLWQRLLEQTQWEKAHWNIALWNAVLRVSSVWKDFEEQELLFEPHDTNPWP